jgi:hypothetical protein
MKQFILVNLKYWTIAILITIHYYRQTKLMDKISHCLLLISRIYFQLLINNSLPTFCSFSIYFFKLKLFILSLSLTFGSLNISFQRNKSFIWEFDQQCEACHSAVFDDLQRRSTTFAIPFWRNKTLNHLFENGSVSDLW